MKIKRIVVIAALLLCGAVWGWAQTADNWVVRGRAFLVMSNLNAAQSAFNVALTNNPAHEPALVLRAFTRLALWPTRSAVSNFLNRLDVPVQGRNLFDWEAFPPTDTNGNLILPDDVRAEEVAALLRTNLLSTVLASGADLAAMTNADFLLHLGRGETHVDDVLVDYGDVLMFRAALHTLEYLIYTTYSWNLDLQWSALRAFKENGLLSIENVLATYPNLLTFATTNDLAAARTAFSKALDRYLDASEFLRLRPGDEPARVFNFDWDQDEDEEQFRCVLTSLKESLDHPVVLCTETNLTISLANHFSGLSPLRALLPGFKGDSILAGTVPDPSFGGMVSGLNKNTVDQHLAEIFPLGTWFAAPQLQTPDQLALQFTTVTGHVYAIEFSTDLADWTELAAFRAEKRTYSYTNASPHALPQGYYRLHDLSDYVRLEGMVSDACSGTPVAGAIVYAPTLEAEAVTDGLGHFEVQTRREPPHSEVEIEVTASGYNTLNTTTWVWEPSTTRLRFALRPQVVTPPDNDMFADRVRLTNFPVLVSGVNCGATQEAGEPWLCGGRTVWWNWRATFDGPVMVQVQGDLFSPCAAVFTGASVSTLSSVPLNYANGGQFFNAVAGTAYRIAVASYSEGPFQLALAPPLELQVSSPVDGAQFFAPADVLISAEVLGGSGQLSALWVRGYGSVPDLRLEGTNNATSVVWSNLSPGTYRLYADAEDTMGFWASTNVHFTVRPPNDDFARRIPLTGSNVAVFGSNAGANGAPKGFVWWSWTAPFSGDFTIRASGNDSSPGNASLLGILTGDTLSNLTFVASNALTGGARSVVVSLAASQGTTYQIAVGCAGCDGDHLLLEIMPGAAPSVAITSPTPGSTFAAGTTLSFTATATDPDGVIRWVELYAGDRLAGAFTNAPYSLMLSNLAPGDLELTASATDKSGITSFAVPVVVRVAPTNDNFGRAILIEGSDVTVLGSNAGASKQVGEPNHGGYSGGRSVWWTWTAPGSGEVYVSANLASDSYSWPQVALGVYTGSAVSSLVAVASNAGSTAQVSFYAQSGVSYRLAVDGPYGQTGTITLQLYMAP